MSCGKQDKSLKHFIEVQKRLSPFVSVPKLFHQDLKEGCLILEDLGDQSLEKLFYKREGAQTHLAYCKALKQLINLQDKVKKQENDVVFHKDFFFKENETAISQLETYIHISKGKDLFKESSSLKFKEDMKNLFLNFKIKDYVYCHRDYHSRNLMWKGGQIVLIDFQDAGLGPLAYDLTSLLYDSYVSLSLSKKEDMISFYFDHLPKNLKKKAQSVSHIDLMTRLIFLQRGFKACGCFAGFKNRDNKGTHLKYIRPTLQLVEKVAGDLSYKGIFQYIKELRTAIEELESRDG